MGRFNENLDLRYGIENNKVVWTLLTSFAYKTDGGHVFEAPSGFKTDLASIPRVFWAFLPPFWKYAKAAVIHDWIIVGLEDRKLANEVFREGMVSLGVNRQQIFVIYKSVCLWAWLVKYIRKS
jgi:hypothetical protein